jgi:hypothetical protein
MQIYISSILVEGESSGWVEVEVLRTSPSITEIRLRILIFSETALLSLSDRFVSLYP